MPTVIQSQKIFVTPNDSMYDLESFDSVDQLILDAETIAKGEPLFVEVELVPKDGNNLSPDVEGNWFLVVKDSLNPSWFNREVVERDLKEKAKKVVKKEGFTLGEGSGQFSEKEFTDDFSAKRLYQEIVRVLEEEMSRDDLKKLLLKCQIPAEALHLPIDTVISTREYVKIGTGDNTILFDKRFYPKWSSKPLFIWRLNLLLEQSAIFLPLSSILKSKRIWRDDEVESLTKLYSLIENKVGKITAEETRKVHRYMIDCVGLDSCPKCKDIWDYEGQEDISLYSKEIIVSPFLKIHSFNLLEQVKTRLVRKKLLRIAEEGDDNIEMPEELCSECKKIVRKDFGYEETLRFKKIRKAALLPDKITDIRQRDDYIILLCCPNCGHKEEIWF